MHMQKFNKILISTLAIVFSFGLFGLTAVHAATTPSLGMADTFGVLSSTFTNSNTAPQTIINGDVGYTVAGAPVTPPITVTGALHPADATHAQAGLDQGTALGILNGQPCTPITGTLDAVIIGGNPAGTFPPGCYAVTGAMNITTGTTITLDLTAPGGVGSTWIFKSTGALTTGASTVGFPSVVLAHGASACNVFWVPVGGTTLGANFALSVTPTFVGTIIDDAGISLGHFANLLGRALDFATTVTTDANTITVPTCAVPPPPASCTTFSASPLSVVSGSPSTLTWTTANATTFTIDNGVGPVTPVAGGTQSVLPITTTTYTGTVDGGATCTATVTVTAPAVSPILTLAKTILNGGPLSYTDFPLTATDTINPLNFITGINGAGTVTGATVPAGSYTLTEPARNNYTAGLWICTNGVVVASDPLILADGSTTTCRVINTYAPVQHYSGGSYTPPIPPLIDVVKVPSPLALPSGPGSVTYTYTLKNIGTVPVSNITMVDDSCSPVTLVSGDTNTDGKLDTNETWIYRCSTTLTKTHTNIVTTTGWANGISATDIANATVVVGASVVPPLIHVTKIPSPLALLSGAGNVIYTEKITNPGTVALNNIKLTDDKCSSLKYISGDLNKDSKLDTTETWVYTCQTRLTKTTTNTATATGEANGITAKDFAIATVVVSTPALPKTGFPPKTESIPWNVIFLGVGVLVSSIVILKKRSI